MKYFGNVLIHNMIVLDKFDFEIDGIRQRIHL